MAVLLLLSASLAAEVLDGQFWLRDDLSEAIAFGKNLRDFEAEDERIRDQINRLLEDAQWVYSGMIYGFNITWSPSAKARGMSETLIIEPIALITRGDAKLEAIATVMEQGFYYVFLRYHPDENQERYLSSWKNQNLLFAAGRGQASIHDGGTRRQAMETAVKESLRNYFRSREFNRPHTIRARVGLLAFPTIGLVDTNLVAGVKLAIESHSLIPYTVD